MLIDFGWFWIGFELGLIGFGLVLIVVNWCWHGFNWFRIGVDSHDRMAQVRVV